MRLPRAALVAGLLLAGACGDSNDNTVTEPPTGAPSSSVPSITGSAAAGECPVVQVPGREPPQFAKPDDVAQAGHYRAVIRTTCGVVELDLDASAAPKTVNSFVFLAGKSYFDNTQCHRLTEGASLTVLQCGDPSGTGTGGPGYGLPEENLPTNDATGTTLYARGTVAMARTSQPGSGGSQFFLVIKDSRLPGDYTIFGKVTVGLDVLDKILATGLTTPQDGQPKNGVVIEDVTAQKA